jgi:hypothetical protein
MNKSESIKELSAALAKAQSEMSNPKKNADNPFFKSQYADLAEVINVSKPVLARHGLSIIQLPGFDDGLVTVETILAHESGEWVSGVMSMMPVKHDPQGLGSCVSYIRRYSLAAVAGLAQEDDDANTATHPVTPNPPAAKRKAPPKTKTGKDEVLTQLKGMTNMDAITSLWRSLDEATQAETRDAFSQKRKSLEG